MNETVTKNEKKEKNYQIRKEKGTSGETIDYVLKVYII